MAVKLAVKMAVMSQTCHKSCPLTKKRMQVLTQRCNLQFKGCNLGWKGCKFRTKGCNLEKENIVRRNGHLHLGILFHVADNGRNSAIRKQRQELHKEQSLAEIGWETRKRASKRSQPSPAEIQNHSKGVARFLEWRMYYTYWLWCRSCLRPCIGRWHGRQWYESLHGE